MKETVLDVLRFLFDHYWDGETQVQLDEATLSSELTEAGFDPREIDKAFLWLEELVVLQNSDLPPLADTPDSFRAYTDSERKKLDPDALGFLIRLEHQGLLDSASREIIIDRAMAIESQVICFDEMKQIVGLVLLNQPSDEPVEPWVEDLFYQEDTAAVVQH